MRALMLLKDWQRTPLHGYDSSPQVCHLDICLTGVTAADRHHQGHVLLCRAPSSHLCSNKIR